LKLYVVIGLGVLIAGLTAIVVLVEQEERWMAEQAPRDEQTF